MSLQEKVYSTVTQSSTPLSARDIARALKCTKKDVNQILYRSEDLHHTSDTPPKWFLKAPQSPTSEAKSSIDPYTPDVPIVLVDLGNVHDTLKPLEPYARSGEVMAFAFADLAFNGYGVNPACDSCIPMFQSKTPDKNAADIEMVWKCAEIAMLNNGNGHALEFYIVTRDQGFRTLETILKRYGHNVTFVRDWNDLKMYVA
jgi:hypothetical protein